MPQRKGIWPRPLTTTLPSDLVERLENQAKKDDRPLNYYIERGLRIVIDGEKP